MRGQPMWIIVKFYNIFMKSANVDWYIFQARFGIFITVSLFIHKGIKEIGGKEVKFWFCYNCVLINFEFCHNRGFSQLKFCHTLNLITFLVQFHLGFVLNNIVLICVVTIWVCHNLIFVTILVFFTIIGL